MRLSVFLAETLSQQLVTDLQKIYLNYLPQTSLTEAAISNSLTSTRLYLTMFNARHIGAVKVQLEGDKATLSELCIRDITRRRGVGKNLLKRIEEALLPEGIKEIQYDLDEVSEEELLATQAFLTNSFYEIDNKLAVKKL